MPDVYCAAVVGKAAWPGGDATLSYCGAALLVCCHDGEPPFAEGDEHLCVLTGVYQPVHYRCPLHGAAEAR